MKAPFLSHSPEAAQRPHCSSLSAQSTLAAKGDAGENQHSDHAARKSSSCRALAASAGAAEE
jgi:hypothetical protein